MMWAAVGLAAVVAAVAAVGIWWAYRRTTDEQLPDEYEPPDDKPIMDNVRWLRRARNRARPPGRHRKPV
jgi:hypothetical protein